MEYDPGKTADELERALRCADRELRPYGLDPDEHRSLRDTIAWSGPLTDPTGHKFRVGDRVRSELSGRTGVVKRHTRAVVLVAYDDRSTNVDYAEAPEAWVPHGVLEIIDECRYVRLIDILYSIAKQCLNSELRRRRELRDDSPAATYTDARIDSIRKVLETVEQEGILK